MIRTGAIGGAGDVSSVHVEPVRNTYPIYTLGYPADWQLSLTGIAEPFRVLRYFDGYWTRPHVDRDYRLADSSKLSCIMQLVPSDDFAGGVLTVAETDAVSLGQGDAVFFPAHEIHTVSEVTRGTRIVLAGWVHGPVLR
jgi:predicted 2-oxoglutarate/Fe(II)-dependent dioxygenase YbiX